MSQTIQITGRMLLAAAFFAGVLGMLNVAAYGGGCRGVCNVQKVQKVVAPVVVHEQALAVGHCQPVQAVAAHAVYPPTQVHNVTFYGVGQHMVERAQLQQAMLGAMEELQFRAKVTGTIEGSVAGSGGYVPPAITQPPVAASPPRFSMTAPVTGAAVEQACASCHTGGAAKGGFSLDGPLTAEQRLAAVRQVYQRKMPPSGELSDTDAAAVLAELSGL